MSFDENVDLWKIQLSISKNLDLVTLRKIERKFQDFFLKEARSWGGFATPRNGFATFSCAQGTVAAFEAKRDNPRGVQRGHGGGRNGVLWGYAWVPGASNSSSQ